MITTTSCANALGASLQKENHLLAARWLERLVALLPVDARSVFKGLLRDQLGWAANDLDGKIFADSAVAKPMSGLV